MAADENGTRPGPPPMPGLDAAKKALFDRCQKASMEQTAVMYGPNWSCVGGHVCEFNNTIIVHLMWLDLTTTRMELQRAVFPQGRIMTLT